MVLDCVLGFIMCLGIIYCFKNIIHGETAIILSFTALILESLKIMHPVYCVLLGIFVAGIFYCAITKVKILRYILSLIISAGVAYYVWCEAHTRLDATWTATWTILSFIIVLGMHWLAYETIYYGPDKQIENRIEQNKKYNYDYFQQQRNFGNKYNRQYREDYFQQQCYSGNEYNQQYYKEDNNNKENDKTEKTNYYEDLFENCGSQEELKKRYRGLMKIYHPDIENGSSEKAMKITEAYEKIMREL